MEADTDDGDYGPELERVEEWKERGVGEEERVEEEEGESEGVEAGGSAFDFEGLAREAARREDHGLAWQEN